MGEVTTAAHDSKAPTLTLEALQEMFGVVEAMRRAEATRKILTDADVVEFKVSSMAPAESMLVMQVPSPVPVWPGEEEERRVLMVCAPSLEGVAREVLRSLGIQPREIGPQRTFVAPTVTETVTNDSVDDPANPENHCSTTEIGEDEQ